MGAKSHMEPRGFSAELNDYLRKVLADNGREDLSGRWLEKITGRARSYDYWSKLVKDTSAMSTNDVQVLAAAFGVGPYEFVANARRWVNGQPVPVLLVNVGGGSDDGVNITEYPKVKPAAAETERKPGD